MLLESNLPPLLCSGYLRVLLIGSRAKVINLYTIKIMFQAILVGHLGADAEVKVSNGQSYLTFRVANTERFKRNGEQVEEVTWYSCIMSGDGGNLKPYLVKGQQVVVIGSGSVRVYSSPKLRRMVGSVDINVRSIELIGRPSSDLVPRQVADGSGLLHEVSKFYAIKPEEAAAVCGDKQSAIMYGSRGDSYFVDKNGWVVPYLQEENGETDAAEEQS